MDLRMKLCLSLHFSCSSTYPNKPRPPFKYVSSDGDDDIDGADHVDSAVDASRNNSGANNGDIGMGDAGDSMGDVEDNHVRVQYRGDGSPTPLPHSSTCPPGHPARNTPRQSRVQRSPYPPRLRSLDDPFQSTPNNTPSKVRPYVGKPQSPFANNLHQGSYHSPHPHQQYKHQQKYPSQLQDRTSMMRNPPDQQQQQYPQVDPLLLSQVLSAIQQHQQSSSMIQQHSTPSFQQQSQFQQPQYQHSQRQQLQIRQVPSGQDHLAIDQQYRPRQGKQRATPFPLPPPLNRDLSDVASIQSSVPTDITTRHVTKSVSGLCLVGL
ncbi:hypothetical protein EDD21DRAFT_426998 [Dissophora ornata]|nr:hypothetical protein EDD21DRAFT_426998 [Dissophora ornata]